MISENLKSLGVTPEELVEFSMALRTSESPKVDCVKSAYMWRVLSMMDLLSGALGGMPKAILKVKKLRELFGLGLGQATAVANRIGYIPTIHWLTLEGQARRIVGSNELRRVQYVSEDKRSRLPEEAQGTHDGTGRYLAPGGTFWVGSSTRLVRDEDIRTVLLLPTSRVGKFTDVLEGKATVDVEHLCAAKHVEAAAYPWGASIMVSADGLGMCPVPLSCDHFIVVDHAIA